MYAFGKPAGPKWKFWLKGQRESERFNLANNRHDAVVSTTASGETDVPKTTGRRDRLRSFAIGALSAASGSIALPAAALSSTQSKSGQAITSQGCFSVWLGWRTGLERHRRADLGDGRFLNAVMPGDHPDPIVLKDGDEYSLREAK